MSASTVAINAEPTAADHAFPATARPRRAVHAVPLVHRMVEFVPPGREEDPAPPDLTGFGRMLPTFLTIEVRRERWGEVHVAAAAPGPVESGLLAASLERAYPRCRVGQAVSCLSEGRPYSEGVFGRAVVQRSHHYWPLTMDPKADGAAALFPLLAGPAFENLQVMLQVNVRPTGAWEAPFYSGKFDKLELALQGKHYPLLSEPWERTPSESERELHRRVTERRREPPCHVEIRAWLFGPNEESALSMLDGWLGQWASINGGTWWRWRPVRNGRFVGKDRRERFRVAFYNHDLRRFSGRKERRNLSATEVGAILPLPWKDHHPELDYVEAAPRPSPRQSDSRTERPHARAPPDLPARPGRVDEPLGVPPLRRPPSPTPTSLGLLREPGLPRVHEEARFRWPEKVRHMAVLGESGMGKSTFLQNLTLHLLEKDPTASVIVVDPAGTLCEDLKRQISDDVLQDTVEFDPTKLVFDVDGATWAAPGFNILSLPEERQSNPLEEDRLAGIVACDLVRAFQNVWGMESVGARASYFMGVLTRGLMRESGANLLDVRDIIVDRTVRERFARNLPEGPIRSFVEKELPQFRLDEFVSTLDKTGRFGHSLVLRAALCQRYHSTNFAKFMDHRLVLLNLARGVTGSDESRILGAAFLTFLWSEVTMRHGEGRRVYLIVDEAQNYAIPSLAEMLSEGRKYGLTVVVANQYLAQLPEDLRLAMLGNLGNWVFFRAGLEDAEKAVEITQSWRWKMGPEQYASLPPYRMVASWEGKGIVCNGPRPPVARRAGEEAAGIVQANTRKHAVLETSEASPYRVNPDRLVDLLTHLEDGPRSMWDLATAANVRLPEALACLWCARDSGLVEVPPAGDPVALSPYGKAYLEAFRARRVTNSEGEEHTELVARASLYVKERWGAEVRPVHQGSSQEPLPDARFETEGRVWNIEAECSTVTTKLPQVVKNLQKARRAGNGCLFVCPSRKDAEKLVAGLGKLLPEARLDRDYAVLYFEGELARYPGPEDSPLPTPSAPFGDARPKPSVGVPSGAYLNETDHLRQAVRETLGVLRERSKEKVTGAEVLAALPEDLRLALSGGTGTRPSSRLGRIMNAEGIPNEKAWDPERGMMVRVYLIGGQKGAAEDRTMRPKEEGLQPAD